MKPSGPETKKPLSPNCRYCKKRVSLSRKRHDQLEDGGGEVVCASCRRTLISQPELKELFMATEPMTTRDAVKRLKELGGLAGPSLYERIRLADTILQDRSYVEGRWQDEGNAVDKMEEEFFPDVCGVWGLPTLLEVFRWQAGEDFWKEHRYNVRRIHSKYQDAHPKAKPQPKQAAPTPEPTPPTSAPPPVAAPTPPAIAAPTPQANGDQPHQEESTTRQRLRQNEHLIRHLEDENKALKDENADLKHKLAVAERKNAVLESRVRELDEELAEARCGLPAVA